MQFTITKINFGNQVKLEFTDHSSQTKIGILPGCGASLNNFIIQTNGRYAAIINGYESGDDLIENLTKNFKGVILSPFANRINKASYSFNESNYILDKVWSDKDYALHGYLFNQSFDVINQTITDEGASLTLRHTSNGQFPGFPFIYETTVIYTLNKNNQLECKTIIKNLGKKLMPLSFGWHPMFFKDVNIDDVTLQFPSEYKIDLDENQIPNGSEIPFQTFNTSRKVDNTIFDHCFKLKEADSGNVVLKKLDEPNTTITNVKLTEPVNRINVELGMETGDDKFKYLQIYIPPERNTIALEPMTSWPDAFNNLRDLIVLEPGQLIEMSYSIKASAY